MFSFISISNCLFINIIALTSISYLDLIGLLTHEITHSVDFIMEEDGYTDMEIRGYMTQDMLVKAMMFINKQLEIEIKENKND